MDADELSDDDNTGDIDVSELDEDDDDDDYKPKRKITAKHLIYIVALAGAAFFFLSEDPVVTPEKIPNKASKLTPQELRKRANEKRKQKLAKLKNNSGKRTIIDKVKADVATASNEAEDRTKKMMDEVGTAKKEDVFEAEKDSTGKSETESNSDTDSQNETEPQTDTDVETENETEEETDNLDEVEDENIGVEENEAESSSAEDSDNDVFGENLESGEKTEDITTKILEDLEKKVQADKGQIEEVVKYVPPPNYDNLGRGLVYSCKGKHWACIDAASYLDCQKNHKYNNAKGKSKECFPVEVYYTIKDCNKAQIKNIDSIVKTDFCQDI